MRHRPTDVLIPVILICLAVSSVLFGLDTRALTNEVAAGRRDTAERSATASKERSDLTHLVQANSDLISQLYALTTQEQADNDALRAQLMRLGVKPVAPARTRPPTTPARPPTPRPTPQPSLEPPTTKPCLVSPVCVAGVCTPCVG